MLGFIGFSAGLAIDAEKLAGSLAPDPAI